MATILVDFENVYSSDGLKGIKYLNKNDRLCIYYSNSCDKIRAEYMDYIERSGCNFKAYKLYTSRKNALDFYIASECGFAGEQEEKQIIIVSKDKGFLSVCDYFKLRNNIANTSIFVVPNIETGLIQLNSPEDFERSKILSAKAKILDLKTAANKYAEKNELKIKVITLLNEFGYTNISISRLEYIWSNSIKTRKQLYTQSLHNLGRKNGLQIYHLLKNIL